MKKYEVGIEFNPNGEMKSTKGLVGGKEIKKVLDLVKLNKKTDSYFHIIYNEKKEIMEIWKLTKKEYDNLRCGFGLTDFGDFLKTSGLI